MPAVQHLFIVVIVLVVAACGARVHKGPERSLLSPATAGISHEVQADFLDRALARIDRDRAFRERLPPTWTGYNATAQLMRVEDVKGLAQGGFAISTATPLPVSAPVVAVVWGHPLRSSFWLIYDTNGEYLEAFVLPEG